MFHLKPLIFEKISVNSTKGRQNLFCDYGGLRGGMGEAHTGCSDTRWPAALNLKSLGTLFPTGTTAFWRLRVHAAWDLPRGSQPGSSGDLPDVTPGVTPLGSTI